MASGQSRASTSSHIYMFIFMSEHAQLLTQQTRKQESTQIHSAYASDCLCLWMDFLLWIFAFPIAISSIHCGWDVNLYYKRQLLNLCYCRRCCCYCCCVFHCDDANDANDASDAKWSWEKSANTSRMDNTRRRRRDRWHVRARAHIMLNYEYDGIENE